jgi:hypothetical protein
MASRKNPLPKDEQNGGVYYTPAWMIRMWVAHHTPKLPDRVLDAG